MKRSVTIAGIALTAGLLVVLALTVFFGGSSNSGATGTSTSTSTSEATTTTTTVAEPACGEHEVILPNRAGGKLNAAGTATPGDPEGFRAQIAEQAAHDPLTLFLYYQASPLGTASPLSNEAVLVQDGRVEDGNCYSAVGISAYNEWLVLWKVTNLTPQAEITFQGVNTGVSGTSPTQSQGVSGSDKSGFDIAYVDANGVVIAQHSALNRCTQPTGNTAPPNVPEGPTDNDVQPPYVCPPPAGVPPEKWDASICRKKDQTYDEMLNGTPFTQPPQDNTTSGIPTGSTPGAPDEPYVPPPGPPPVDEAPAPAPLPGGNDSGSQTGSGTPGGSTGDSTGVIGGGPTGPAAPPVPVDNGDHNVDPGGF